MDRSNRHSLPEHSAPSGRGFLNASLVLAAAVGLSWFFFPKLWGGGGLIGGDTYTYYFPQKVVLQDALRDGRLPLWNSVVSLGYPQLAESQTGALSPLNIALYRFFDVNTAYNASHLLHYIAAYVFTWLLARRFGIGAVGSHLAALSFVYGWFPARACLEWAIIGGAFFPAIVWCVESYLQSGKVRWLAIASVALAAFLTTGHFNLAFITLLVSTLLVALRLTWATDGLADRVRIARWPSAAKAATAVVLGFLLAAPQLIPSAELKSASQREGGGFNQAYGNIPLWYLTQPLWPTLWFAPDINPDENLFNSNRIEAHLYFGVIPFYLAVAALFWRTEGRRDRRIAILVLAGLGGVVLATGWPMPVLRLVPGFGYFAGPGRYGMMTALAVGVVAGRVLDRLLQLSSIRVFWPILTAVVFTVTTFDLSYVHDCVTYLTFVNRAPISIRHESPVGRLLRSIETPVRVFAPGPNLPSIMGVNCVPEYLGIGPKQYYDKRLAIPRYSQEDETPELRQSLIRWLQQAGATHILAQSALVEADWPVSPATVVRDPFLNAAWGRGGEPLYLYSLQGSRAHAFLEGQVDGQGVMIREERPEAISLEVDSDRDGRVVLLDLLFPGWQVTVDGQPVDPELFEEVYRSVRVPAGKHVVEWSYSPGSFRLGLIVFAFAATALLVWLFIEARQQTTAVRTDELPQHR
ncbi:glycosyltransferase family protein [Caulifigura coniformis]|uniref:YfhO family protein n=1 Tax=Caulifigura coniformis TaxID=2527983 RepID=UPI0011A989FB|nr:YfhO family protein [Caulifigura coniformis]